MVTLQFPNSDVIDVLHFYENLTGVKLVIDNNVQGKVNIFIAQKVPRKEAVTIIEMNLALNGFSLVPTEGDVVEVVGREQESARRGGADYFRSGGYSRRRESGELPLQA